MSASQSSAHADVPIPVVRLLTGSPQPSALPQDTVSAVRATLKVLYHAQSSIGEIGPHILPAQLILVPGSRKFPPTDAADIVGALTERANAAAASLACGSILAGQSSESDEFGDVAFWLGDGAYGRGEERSLLRALGLEAEVGQQIESVAIGAASCLPHAVPGGSLPSEVGKLSEMLAKLDDLHSFQVPLAGGDANGIVMLYVLAGRSGKEWLGILGLGVQSDA